MSECELRGKTIEKIEDDSPGPSDTEGVGSRFLIYFTDGSALEVTASGGWDGEGYPDHELIDAAGIAARHAARKLSRDRQEQRRREREAWLALSCSERARRSQRNKRPPSGSIIPSMLEDMLLEDTYRRLGKKLKARCGRCGERECPNAVEHVFRESGVRTIAGTISIPKDAP